MATWRLETEEGEVVDAVQAETVRIARAEAEHRGWSVLSVPRVRGREAKRVLLVEARP